MAWVVSDKREGILRTMMRSLVEGSEEVKRVRVNYGFFTQV